MNRGWQAGWTLSVMLACVFPIHAEEVIDLALVIGNNHYVGDPDRDLRYADDDAFAAAETFLALHPYGRLWLLVDPDADTLATRPPAHTLAYRPPTLDAWDEALQQMARVVETLRSRGPVQVHLFLHFSGHGERGGTLHFADQRLSARSFRLSLSRVGADEVFALMDGCHLAQVVRDGDHMTTLPPPPIFEASDMATPDRPGWLGLIGATTAAPEQDYLAGGLLSLVGLSALRGPADLDDDGRITFSEWGDYVAKRFDGVEGGPQIVVVHPRKHRRTTVIDLHATHLGAIRLEPGFPDGQVRVVKGRSRRLVAEVYHEGVRPTVIQLRPGRYTVMRFLHRKAWRHPGYPVETIDVVVGRNTVVLGRHADGEFVVLLPEGMKGEGDPPEPVDTWVIDPNEERSILNSPFRQPRERPEFAASAWTLFAGLPSPNTGPDLTGTGDPHHGGLLRMTRTRPLRDSGRWFLAWGVSAQVQWTHYAELWVNNKDKVTDAFHAQTRIGPVLRQTWALPRGRTALDIGIAYAPGWVTDGMKLIRDPSIDAGLQQADRYVFLQNVAADLWLSWCRVFRPGTCIGPSVMGDVLRFRLPALTDTPPTVAWVSTLAVGVTVSW